MHYNFLHNLQVNDIDQAYNTLKSWIMQTACHPHVGMTKSLESSMPFTHSFQPENLHGLMLSVTGRRELLLLLLGQRWLGMLAKNYTNNL
eukprot:1141075-Pelagomonas_calceolata.AAC.2